MNATNSATLVENLDVTAATPLEDPLELIQQGINAMFDPNDVVEVRVPKAGRNRTISGYYDDHEKMAHDLASLDGRYAGIYFTLNPCDPALLARASNRLKNNAEQTTSDPDILQRAHLLIDADPVRPAGISSTDEEKECSRAQMRLVFKYLRSLGWADPLVADSGNGFHLIYDIDLPNDKECADLVKAVLASLAARFDNPQSKIDKSVFNAARIVKAYGTTSAKGDSITSRPHRRAQVLTIGSRTVVTRERLQAVAAEVPSPAPKNNTSSKGSSIGIDSKFVNTPEKVEENLALCGVEHHEMVIMPDGRPKWVLNQCAFDPEHVGKDAAVFINNDGSLGHKCLHNSCADNHWKEFRAKVEELSNKQMHFTSSGKVTVGTTKTTSTAALPVPKVSPNASAEPTYEECRALFSSGDQMSDKELKFLIENFLPEECITMIGGLAGHQKTLFAMAMARALTYQKKLFGYFPTLEQLPVVYLIPECGDISFRKRMKAFELDDPTKFIDPDMFLCRTFSMGPKLELDDSRLLKFVEGRVVILDTACRFTAAKDENSSADNQVLAESCFNLLKAGARSVIGLHHAGKGFETKDRMTLENVLRGSGDIGAMLGACYGVCGPNLGREARTPMQIGPEVPEVFQAKSRTCERQRGVLFDRLCRFRPCKGQKGTSGPTPERSQHHRNFAMPSGRRINTGAKHTSRRECAT